MQFDRISRFFQFLLACCVLAAGGWVKAQPTGLLYDPEPPADSAYVRVVIAGREGAVDVWVDGRMRIRNVRSGEASEYMVLAAGKRNVALHAIGKTVALTTFSLDVISGRAISLGFVDQKADAVPLVFEDKANSNKLKALLAVYHLNRKVGALDVTTADRATQVFPGLVFGKSSSIQVNPIAIELLAAPVGSTGGGSRASLSMTSGATYSMLLLPAEGGRLSVAVVQNKIERYTGK